MDTKQAKVANFQYDSEMDVMYFSFGEPQDAVGEEIEDGVVIRFNPTTGQPVGVTISDFTVRFKRYPEQAVSVPLTEFAHA